MKKIFVIILSAIALVGCTLEEKVISSSEPGKYYQTVPQCLTGLNGCYIPLRSIYANADYFEACEVATDLIYHSSSSYYDAHCDYTQSIPRFGNTIWNQCYLGVMRCNAMYASIERAPLTEEEKTPLLAECEILRAYYYYILTINFGDVPYYFEEVTDANNDKIAQLPRMSAEDLRDILMDNIWMWLGPKSEGCKQALPYIKTYDPQNEYRIGAMVGFTIAGKLAMWNKDWDRAIKFYSFIEKVYCSTDEEGLQYTDPRYALLGYPVKDIMNKNRYSAESIFVLPAYSKDYGLRVTHSLASRCTPSRSSTTVEGAVEDDEIIDDEEGLDLSKKDDMYNGIRIPELGAEARTTSPYRPTKYFYSSASFNDFLGTKVTKGLMPYNAKDKRRSRYDTAKAANTEMVEIEDGGGYLAWCYGGWSKTEKMEEIPGDGGVPRHILFFSSTAKPTGRPFLGDKFWCFGMIYNQDSNNVKIFRFANILLDLAEAQMRMGNWDLANSYLNAPKQRAGLDVVYYTDEVLFMEELYAESGRELFGEFTRRHNLVRWGIWQERVMRYSEDSRLRENAAAGPCRIYYPIPDQQVVLSNYNLDNKEYDKYGL